jgi:hypothetical protein
VILLAMSLSAGAPEGHAAGWYPLGGASWYVPLDSGVEEIYGSGPGFDLGLGYAISRRFRAEIALGWFRATGSPRAGLVSSTRGTLTALPFTAEARALPASFHLGGRPVAVWLSAGPALVFAHEELRYRAFERTTTLKGRRSDIGGTAAAGFELQERRWRAVFGARALLTGGHREVLRAGGRSDERSAAATPSLGSIALEVRVPL